MNLREALLHGGQLLEEAGIAESKNDAWLLFEFVTNISRTRFYMDCNNQMPDEEFAAYMELIEKRKTHYPLQYITRVQQFMGYDFYVDEAVLIPRPETEGLVELVEESIDEMLGSGYNLSDLNQKRNNNNNITNSNNSSNTNNGNNINNRNNTNNSNNSNNSNNTNNKHKRKLKVLDMCTGSGCIAVSIALDNSSVNVTAVDISEAALAVARKNASELNAQVEFVCSDLFSNLNDEKFDIIVSNPPYIETKELDVLMEEVIKHEPVLALDGMADGLFFYRKIIAQSVDFLNPGGRLFFEIGYNQGISVSELMKEARFSDIKIIKDLSGLDRIVCGGI